MPGQLQALRPARELDNNCVFKISGTFHCTETQIVEREKKAAAQLHRNVRLVLQWPVLAAVCLFILFWFLDSFSF